MKEYRKERSCIFIFLTSNMTIYFNVSCAIMKYMIGDDSDGALVITIHGSKSYHTDAHIMQKVA